MLVKNRDLNTRGGPSLKKTNGAEASPHRSQLWMSVLCVAIYAASVALIWPVVELATDDDFAYARIALAFARTGHFVYNGWETAMLGWQVVWGALFIRLFGYSYLTLRFSTIVLGGVLAFLLHRVLLRTGVRGAAAVAGTLTVVLSPLFLPMVTSYMTDVPGMLCILVCLYGCQRALRAGSDRTALIWLCGSAALNVVGGTVRQIVWLGALVMVPSAFWLLRNRKGFKTVAVVTWVFSVIGIVLLMQWFSHQPYGLTEHIIRGRITGNTLFLILRISLYGPLEVLLLSLPIFAAWMADVREVSRRRRLHILAACAIASPLVMWAAHYGKIQGRLPPWTGNVVSKYGILASVPVIGDRAEVLTVQIRSLLALALGVALAGFVLWLRARRREGWRKVGDGHKPVMGNALSLYETCVLILPFCISYVVLMFPRAAFHSTFSDVFDRYFLPLLMVAIIVLLRLLMEDQRELPVTCYTILVIFSFFAITATHDLFVTYRAVASARAKVEASGVSGMNISGPWEQDGANQIDVQGYMNDDRVELPAGAYRWAANPPLEHCDYMFGQLVPALHFDYVLTVEHLKCLEPSQFPDVTYTTWLTPFQRKIYIERVPGSR